MASKSYRNIDPEDFRVILLHRSGRILPELSERLANLSHRLLERRGIYIRLHAELRGATGDSALLADDVYIPTRTLVATIGASPNPILADIACEKERGRLVVDDTLVVKGGENLWAVGDCALVPDVLRGGYCPPTAQFALREAKSAARNVLATIRGAPTKPFKYKSRGVFVPLGGFAAAAESFGLELSGFIAWWLYRTFYPAAAAAHRAQAARCNRLDARPDIPARHRESRYRPRPRHLAAALRGRATTSIARATSPRNSMS